MVSRAREGAYRRLVQDAFGLRRKQRRRVVRALTAGTLYCFVCQSNVANATYSANIGSSVGNCGALPVELQTFDAE